MSIVEDERVPELVVRLQVKGGIVSQRGEEEFCQRPRVCAHASRFRGLRAILRGRRGREVAASGRARSKCARSAMRSTKPNSVMNS